jgi:hypothetical protein
MITDQSVAVVTGGARGIGREIARTLAFEGYTVFIGDKDDAAGNECAEAIRTGGGDAKFVHADISVPSEVSYLIDAAGGKTGTIDILINNAGFGIWKHPEDLTVQEWDAVIDTNLRGAFLCSREAVKYMGSKGGVIINIASTRAIMSEPGSEAYAASKGGLISLTHAMAASLSERKIRVNCISPGWIETGDYSRLSPADHKQHFSGRVGRPSDIAQACLYLLKNDFVNGANLIIDGGMTRKMIYAE